MMKCVWFLLSSCGCSRFVKKVLVPAIESVVKTPEVVNAIRQIGAIEDFVPGEEFKKMMTDEYEMVRKLMKTSAAEGK